MNAAERAIANVAKRLEEIALDSEMGELQTLADELGAVNIPNPQETACTGNCRRAQEYRSIVDQIGAVLERNGYRPRDRRLDDREYAMRMALDARYVPSINDPFAALKGI